MLSSLSAPNGQFGEDRSFLSLGIHVGLSVLIHMVKQKIKIIPQTA